MFTKPRNGWTDVELGSFRSRASYLTDIPHDCLDAFIFALENDMPATIYFDAEGWDFHLVSSYYNSYIIEEKDLLRIYKLYVDYIDLAKELVCDIGSNLDDWADWTCYKAFDYEIVEENKKILIEKLNKLNKLIEKKG